jgi:UDP-glucose 4-epimerase
MVCLITGGAGFIGSHLAIRLLHLRMGAVRVIDNLSRPRWPIAVLRRDGVEAAEGDIRDASDLRSAMAGCTVVFHLAAKATVMDCESDPIEAFAVNARGTYGVLAMAQELGVKRVVVASSREVYGEAASLPVGESTPLRPKNVYGVTKAAAESWCASIAAEGLEVTILRLSNVYGPGDTNRVLPRFIQNAKAGTPLMLYGGGQVVDFVWIDAVVEAFVAAGFGPHVHGAVNIGSGTGMTILETARRVLAGCRSASPLQVLEARSSEVSGFVADIRRAERELGFVRPVDPLAELARLIAS